MLNNLKNRITNKTGIDPSSKQGLVFEALEPRILLSADLAGALTQLAATEEAILTTGFEEQILEDTFDQKVVPAAATVESKRELAFIDDSADDYQQLIDDLKQNNPSILVFTLDGEKDGFEQIQQVLNNYNNIDAVHFVTHGNDGQIKLGNTIIQADNLNQFKSELINLGQSLSDDADLLFYGCDVAETNTGRSLLDQISIWTKADIAASDDLTGHTTLKGDWQLEYQTGLVDTEIIFSEELQSNWSSLLATLSVDTSTDENDGDTSSITNLIATPGGSGISLREAIIAANNTSGSDTITLSAGAYVLTNDLNISSDITINGAGMGSTIIDANGAGRAFTMVSGGVLNLNNLDVTGGDSGTTKGGAINISSGATVNLSSVDIYGNSTTNHEGGGIYNQGTFTAIDSLFRNNSVGSNQGGALSNQGNMTLTRVSVVNNTAAAGGGIQQSGGNLTMINVTVSGNQTQFDGAGLHVTGSGTTTISYSTFANNSTVNSGNGGGIHRDAGSITVSNSIFADNSSQFGAADLNGSITSDGFNIVEDYSGFTPIGSDITGVDPGLAALVFDGSSRQYIHVITTSSNAFDAGGGSPPTTDQRGLTRDGNPDIGSYEVAPANSPPTAVNNTISTDEDVTYTFSASDFNFADPDGGDTLASIQITTLESTGRLQLSGVDVTLNQVISKANIDAGNLKFIPVPNANGTSYDSFAFSVNDGSIDSVTSYTMTVDVNSINDAPIDIASDPMAHDLASNTITTIGSQTGTQNTSATLSNGRTVTISVNGINVDAEVFDSLGTSLTGQFQIFDGIDYATAGNATNPVVAALPDGGFVVAAQMEGYLDSGNYGKAIIVRAFDSAGNEVELSPGLYGGGYGILVSHSTDGNAEQITPTLDIAGDNTVTVSWNNTTSGLFEERSFEIYDASVGEDAATGTVVTTLTGIDPEGGALTYSIVGGNTNFEVVGNKIQVKAGATLDFETTTSYTLTIRATDTGALSYDEQFTILINDTNDIPIIDDGGPYNIDEGNALNLDASGTTDIDSGVLTYRWDLDNDGSYDDLITTSSNSVVSWTTLNGLGINDDGSYTIKLQVDDGSGGVVTSSTTLTVTNVAPTLSATGGATANGNGTYTLNLANTDPGNDTISGWIVNWGDGTITTHAGDPSSVTHTYSNAVVGLTFNITVSAIDEDGTHFGANLMVPSYAGTDAVHIYNGSTAEFLGLIAPLIDGLDDHVNIVTGPNGNYFVSGISSHNVLQYQPNGTLVGTFITSGSGGLNGAAGLAFGPDGNLYVSSYGSGAVLRYDGSTGAFIDEFVPPATAGITSPLGITFGPDGDLYVASRGTNGVLRFDGLTGTHDTSFVAPSISQTEDITFGPDGNLYVASLGVGVLRLDASTGNLIDTFVSVGSDGLIEVAGIAFGPDGNLYISDQSGDAIRRYAGLTGVYIDDYVPIGGGGLDSPAYLTFTADHQVSVIGPNMSPSVATNTGATFSEGSTGNVITTAMLEEGDPDDAGAELTYTVITDVVNGTLKLNGSLIGTSNTFTQADIDTGLVTYDHDGSVTTTDSFTFSLADGGENGSTSVTATFSITIAPANTAPTFVTGDGMVTTIVGGGSSYAKGVTLQTDGKIVVVGNSDLDVMVTRYNSDGSLDTSFGGDGIVSLDVAGSFDNAYDVVIQPDGKILVAGEARVGTDDFLLIRYNTDGTLDTSFGGDGIVTSDIAGDLDEASSLVLQPDGKIVLAGRTFSGSTYDVALIRYNSNGTLDTSFSGDGIVITDFGGSENISSITLQSDGKIVVAGYSSGDFAIARYNSNGTLDTSFSGDGKLITDLGSTADFASSVVIQSDGKILVGGHSNNTSALVRYNSNGTLDSSFSGDGKLITSIGSSSFGMDVKVQSDGKILLGGYSHNGSDYDFTITRYLNNGSLDTSFGGGDGIAITDIDGDTDRARSIILDSEDKIIIVGDSNNGSDIGFGIVRYNSDGSPDTRFALENTLDGNPTFVENGSTVILDNDVQIFDAELSGIDNFDGATLALARNAGANTNDIFSATGSLSTLTEGGNLVVAGTTIGAVTTNSTGTLLLTFNSSATNDLINSTMQQIAYSNASDNPATSIQIDWGFNDGNTGSQGPGGSLNTIGGTVVAITAVNDTPVVSAPGSTLIATEQVGLAIHGTGFGVTDLDETGSGVTATLTVGKGVLTVNVGDSGAIISSGNGSGTVVINGTIIQINNLLTGSGTGTITYLNKSDAPSPSTTISVTVNDLGNTGSDPGLSGNGSSEEGTNSQTINITTVNDTPLFTSNNLITNGEFNIDMSGWTTTGNIDWSATGIRFGQVGGVLGELIQSFTTVIGKTYFVTFDYGDLSISSDQSLRIQVDGSTNLLDKDITSGITDNTLQRYTYTFVADSTSTSLTFTDTSASHAGVRGYLDNISVQSVAVPRPATSFIENGSAIVVDDQIALADVDDTNIESASIEISSGFATAEDVLAIVNQNGISGSWNSSTGKLTLTGTATLDQYETALSSITYSNTSENPSTTTRTVSFTVNDGNGNSNVATRDITITAINDAPVLNNAVNITMTSQTEDSGTPSGTVGTLITDLVSLVGSGGNENVTDADASQTGIAITAADTSDGSWWYSTDGGVVWNTLGTVSDSNARLLNASSNTRIYFQSDTNYNGTITSALTFRAWDRSFSSSGSLADTTINGGTTAFSSDTDTAQLTIISVNDAPVLTNGSNVTRPEGSGHASFNGSTISDIDSTDFDGGILTFTDVANIDPTDTLYIEAIGGVSISGTNVLVSSITVGSFAGGTAGTPLTISFNNNATLSRVQSVFQAFSIGNFTQNPIAGTRNIEAVLTDGDGGTSNTAVATLTVTAINDDPTNDGALPTDITVAEDIASNIDLSAIDLNDVDHNGGNLTMTLTTSTGGNLSALTAGGVTVAGNGGGILTLTGTVANLNTFLNTASITYLHSTTNFNGNNADTIQVNITDNNNTGTGGGGTINFGVVNINITAGNDNPVIVANNVLNMAQSDTATITTALLEISDPDNTPAQITITNTSPVSNGQLELTTAPGVAITNFTYEDLSNNLVIYVHNNTPTTSDSFTFNLTDSSGGSSGPYTFNISITLDTVAPIVINNTGMTIAENSTNTITSTELRYDDAIQAPSSVIYNITSRSNGQVELATAPGDAITSFTQAQINANQIVFVHNGAETSSGSFNFDVDDGLGHILFDQVFNITVTPVNDNLPIFTSPASSNVIENSTVVHQVTVTDSDRPNATITWSLLGTDASLFSIDTSGNLKFLTAPSFESPVDSDHNNTYEITIAAFDGVNTSTQSIVITVTNENNFPTTSGISNITVNEDSVNSVIDLSSSFSDQESTLTYSITSNTNSGLFSSTVINNIADTLTLDYAADQNGVTTITIRATDSEGLFIETSFVVTVNAINHAPIATDDAATVENGGNININLINNDSDDEDALDFNSLIILSSPTSGSLIDYADGTISYFHDGSAALTDSFTYTINDNNGLTSNVVTVNITITTTNMIPIDSSILLQKKPDQPQKENESSSEEDKSNNINEDNVDENQSSERNQYAPINEIVQGKESNILKVNPTDIFTSESQQNLINTEQNSIAHFDPEEDKPLKEVTKKSLRNSTIKQQESKQDEYSSIDKTIFTIDPGLLHELKQIGQEISEEAEQQTREQLIFERTAEVGSVVMFAGFVKWLLQASSLAASLLGALPAWRWMDPIPVLINAEEGEDKKKNQVKKNRDLTKTIKQLLNTLKSLAHNKDNNA